MAHGRTVPPIQFGDTTGTSYNLAAYNTYFISSVWTSRTDLSERTLHLRARVGVGTEDNRAK